MKRNHPNLIYDFNTFNFDPMKKAFKRRSHSKRTNTIFRVLLEKLSFALKNNLRAYKHLMVCTVNRN